MQWAKHFDVENAADKAPTTMLHLKVSCLLIALGVRLGLRLVP
jgi:hypothetical protein